MMIRNRCLVVVAIVFVACGLLVTLLRVRSQEIVLPSSTLQEKGVRQEEKGVRQEKKEEKQETRHCVAQRDSDNTFYLTGTWTENATLAASLGQQHAGTCGAGQRIYPYDGHGCCLSKPKAVTSVFCPELYTVKSGAAKGNTTSGTPIYSPRKTIDSFLKTIQGRNILFLGDSITLQMFAAIAMELRANQIKFQWLQHTPAIMSMTVPRLPEPPIKLKLVYFYRLEDVNRTGLNLEGPAPNPMHIKDTALIPIIQEADIVIANVGLHHWGMPEYHYRELKHVQDLIEKENQARSSVPQQQPTNNANSSTRQRKNICLLWRRTLPQHFETKNGSGQYGDRVANYTSYGCVPSQQPWKHPSDKAFDRLRSRLSTANTTVSPKNNSASATAMMDYTSILQGANAFHSLQNNNADCSHFCYSPLIWSPILHLTEETIRQAC